LKIDFAQMQQQMCISIFKIILFNKFAYFVTKL